MMGRERHIVAMGGGGFSDDDPAIDEFVVALAGRSRPRLCFVPTASGDSERYLTRFYRAFPSSRFDTSDLPVFPWPPAHIWDFLLEQDVVYVGGGNTANLLALWRLHRIDAALREAWEAGVLLCGISAGANCWFEACTTDSFGPEIAGLRDGLGLLPGSFCPHYDVEPLRRPTFHQLVEEGFPPGYAADDSCVLHFVGTDLAEAVASRPGARAYRVDLGPDGRAVETALPARLVD